MRHFTGKAKIKWNVYSGQPFTLDEFDRTGLEVHPLGYGQVASALLDDKVSGAKAIIPGWHSLHSIHRGLRTSTVPMTVRIRRVV